MKKQVLFLFVTISLITCNRIEKNYIDIFNERIGYGGFNGNVLVFADDKILLNEAYGIANIHNLDSLHINSVFRLGSVSKQFTAMAIAILEEDGLLTYNQDMQDIIPELPYWDVTIENLLQHTSGLPDYLELMMDNWKTELNADDPSRYISGNQDIIEMMVEKHPKIHFEPGEKWEYSNTGYVLLATIVERVSKKSFNEFLQDRIFEPAGMKNTSVYQYVKEEDSKMPLRVFGFKKEDGILVANDTHFLNFAKGDGGIYSTLEDLLRWDRILYTNELVSTTTLEKVFTSGVLNNGESFDYGFGWFIESVGSKNKSVYHGGGWVGFGTYIYRDTSSKSCFIILTNNSSWKEVEKLVKEFKIIMEN